MAEVILFHHAEGLTPGVVAFAEELRGAGHTVQTPDLFEGRAFDEDDDWGNVPVARELAETIDTAELFLYPGDRHLFTDRSLPAYDPQAAGLVVERVQAFLEGTG